MPFRTISINALAVGLCSLIPLPFVDEWVRKHMMKGGYLAIGDQLGVTLEPTALETLARSHQSMVWGCVNGVVIWPVKKLFKTIFFVLLIKDAGDWAAEAALRGAMLRKAIGRGLLPTQPEAVREAMELAWKEKGRSPLRPLLMRKPDAPLNWKTSNRWPHRLVARLAQHAGGVEVLEAFHERMGDIERGKLTGPEPKQITAQPAGEGAAGEGAALETAPEPAQEIGTETL